MSLPLKGNIKETSLIKLLVHLNREQKTGTLVLVTPNFTKKIFLQNGDAVFASSSYEDDRLGEMLIKAGKITVEQYDRSVEILKATKKRQGAILVELGYLTPKDLFWGVKYQVKEIIQSMFLIEDAAYEFIEGELPQQEVITLKMSMGNLIYAGVNQIVNWTRIRREMPHTDSVLALSSDPLTLFQDIELTPQDKKILSLINGRSTIKQVIDSSWMGSFDALKILYVLWSIGMIEEKKPGGQEAREGAEKSEESMPLNEILRPLTEEEEDLLKKVDLIHAKLATTRFDDLLEVNAKTSVETIKKNYYRLAKEFHPDRYFSSADPEVKGKLTQIFNTLTKAYETLKDPVKRKEYYASLSTAAGPAASARAADHKPAPAAKPAAQKPAAAAPRQPPAAKAAPASAEAEEQFKKGVAEFKKGNFQGAADSFTAATTAAPKNASYWSYLSLAYSKLPGRIKDAEEALLTALKVEPFNADFHANLGLIYIRANQMKKARASFEKALKIDPKNEKAKKGLEQVKG
ncbi:MAG: hypothetical protein OHK006_06780 [Thermodesulfovibrionales bacterium]